MKKDLSKFVREFEQYYSDLKIIDYRKDNVLAINPTTNKAYFAYYVNSDISFCFNLLSECRDADAMIFKRMIRDSKYELYIEETKTDYYNVLRKEI